MQKRERNSFCCNDLTRLYNENTRLIKVVKGRTEMNKPNINEKDWNENNKSQLNEIVVIRRLQKENTKLFIEN